jgi:hypothetical protein
MHSAKKVLKQLKPLTRRNVNARKPKSDDRNRFERRKRKRNEPLKIQHQSPNLPMRRPINSKRRLILTRMMLKRSQL